MTEQLTNGEFQALLDFLRRSRGFDFTQYKPASLQRRINKRMQTVGIEGYENYQDYLEVHPEEFGVLFDTILINVTAFFRDPEAWETVANEVIPRILKSADGGEPIRVWSAGCASGEEPYTIAMLLAEALSPQEYRERVKIYATDIDEEALNEARHASYSAEKVKEIPSHLVTKYFDQVNSQYVVKKELRQCVIFGRNDLLRDAPISRLNLLVCRNTLMYFNTEAQNVILGRFHFALSDGGFLFLGSAESSLNQSKIFYPVELHQRIFVKLPTTSPRGRALIPAQGEADRAGLQWLTDIQLGDAAFDASPAAQIVVDNNGHLVLASQTARTLFDLHVRDLGRPFHDLGISYRPVELRSRIEQVYIERRPVRVRGIEWTNASDQVRSLDLLITPLADTRGNYLGTSITFTDVSEVKLLEGQLQRTTLELRNAMEELQSTNEELETTNEELQSTNEELETMNEELQSTNAELHTINEESEQRSQSLEMVNALLDAILTGLPNGVVVLDRDANIIAWNRRAEDLWGLRAEEVRQTNFFTLDIGLPVGQLTTLVRKVIAGQENSQTITLDAINRRGRSIRCRVTASPMMDSRIYGVILLMEEVEESPASGDGSASANQSAERSS